MLRSLAVLAFSVLAADIVAANPATLRAMQCDDNVEIGVSGAAFSCRAELENGLVEQIRLTMDREGVIHPDTSTPTQPLKHSSDPWD